MMNYCDLSEELQDLIDRMADEGFHFDYNHSVCNHYEFIDCNYIPNNILTFETLEDIYDFINQLITW